MDLRVKPEDDCEENPSFATLYREHHNASLCLVTCHYHIYASCTNNTVAL